MRAEAMVAAVLTAGGATAIAVSSCGGSSKKSSSSSASSAVSQPSTPTTATATAPPKPRTLEVRVNGRTTRLLVSEISFAYCRKSPAVCAAVRSSQEKQLTPNQRKAVDAARQTIKDQQSEPAPAPLPSPEPAPVPGPEPQPAPEGTSTG
jgi:hypothetical protein